MGNVGAVLDLLEAGARFHGEEKVGVDLLNRLASQGDVSDLQQLLERGGDSFDIDETDRDGRTPLACAIANRSHAVAMALLDRGAIVRNADRALFEEWLQWLEAQAENAYDKMSDAPSPMASGHYANAKDFLHDAIALARRLDRQDTVARLSARLTHIKAVFRSQF
jgi:ankyrin repeat protein